MREQITQLILSFTALLLTVSINGQNSKPSSLVIPAKEFAASKTALLKAQKLDIPNKFSLKDSLNILIRPRGSKMIPKEFYQKEFKKYKDTAKLKYSDESSINRLPNMTSSYVKRFGFDANREFNWAPSDNSIAVSEDNNVISITNDYIELFVGQEFSMRQDLESFIDFESPSPCDPLVYYDREYKRFILFLQRCDKNYKQSEILVAFSKTNNPIDGWNFYKLTGNPLNKKKHWFDYPKIGVTTEGLFISGNIFKGAKDFDQTVVYQIDKHSGFAGKEVNFRVWHDIFDYPTTLKPVGNAFHDDLLGGIYIIGVTASRDATYNKLYEILGSIYDDSATMNFYEIPIQGHNYFAEATQIGGAIDNGDMRIQDAILNDKHIYYTYTSGDSRNFSRVNFNVLNVESLANRSILLGEKLNGSYAYPSLHFLSNEFETPILLIQYNGASYQTFPSIYCVTCDLNLVCGKEQLIKKGSSTIISSDTARWGDYSTIARSPSEENSLWLASSYGKNRKRQTYISNIIGSTNNSQITFQVPGFLENRFMFEFSSNKNRSVELYLVGEEKKLLTTATVERGSNLLELNPSNLPDYGNEIILLDVKSDKVIEKIEINKMN